jgi:hypothetical protein
VRHRPPLIAAALAVALLAGCGGDAGDGRALPPPPGAARLALLDAPRLPDEVVVRGEASPREHGPFRLDGRYVVRFEQAAPEDPELDFTTQTSFAAALRRGKAAVPLFREAARTGRREVRLRGRYTLEVTFGDYPYAIRITPVREEGS